MITQARLKELLYYHPESGDWVWLVTRGRAQMGDQAGALSAGYTRIKIDGASYLGHRLAFLYMTGAFPEADADHRDLQRGNGVWENLRPSTRSQNRANTAPTGKSGLKGVRAHGNKFRAAIKGADGKNKHLGLFLSPEDASAAFAAAAKERHGAFARL